MLQLLRQALYPLDPNARGCARGSIRQLQPQPEEAAAEPWCGICESQPPEQGE